MMKKLLFMVTFCMFLLTGCGEDKPNHTFITVEKAPAYTVVYHKDTKVMYTVSNGTYSTGNFTLLVNPDGSPMLWEEE